jgi:CRISPR-associated endonuclease Csn1
MKYRLGLDVGANSIGWCVLVLNMDGFPVGIAAMGVRVFPDGRNPKDGASLAEARRGPRAMRRNRDRYLQRRTALLNALTRFGLMPAEEGERRKVAELDPYALRQQALARPLAPFELGRVLFHINQRRGFKSNRKTDKGSNEGGLIKNATAETETAMMAAGQRTLGGWLAQRHAARLGVRVRLAGSGKTAAYPFYPSRAMLEHEFDTIWRIQSAFTAALTEDMGQALRHVIFHQRPLKDPLVGKCWMEPAEFRAARALPTAQRFRIAQSLAHLRLSEPHMPERPLTDDERAKLAAILYGGKDLSQDQTRKKLKLPAETDFNFRDDKIEGCKTAAKIGKVLGKDWHDLSLDMQDRVAIVLLDCENHDLLAASLEAAGLPADLAARLADADPSLPDGHAALSAKALARILPHLEAGKRYDEAVKDAGYAHHSDRRTGEVMDRLPYYGQILDQRIGTGTADPEHEDLPEKFFGKAPNPTVHVALNEIRRVVNDIVDRFGAPAEIVVETLRSLGRSKKQREEYEAEQRKNKKANDDLRQQLKDLNIPDNPRNMARARLWRDQSWDPKDRLCPITGTRITLVTALSDAVEEDHILPYALTLDDSIANRMLVTREANRAKSRQSPFQAFGHSPDWPAILERAQLMPKNKRWRFQPDALDRLAEQGDFLARHLTDSATIARWAVEYLEVLAPGKVRSAPGRLTAILRAALGLNSATVLGRGGPHKDRTDHRHHAIDAVVVALTDRSLLQSVTRAAQAADAAGRRLVVDLDEPWDGFVADVARAAQDLIVSYKPDTGWQGALHNDTAYGLIRGATGKQPNVVVRRPLDSLAKWKPEDAQESIADGPLAAKIAAILDTIPDEPGRKAAFVTLTHCGQSVRSVRCTEKLDSKQVFTDRRTGKPYKAVKLDGNHCAEIWRSPCGKLEMKVVPRFDAAAQANGKPTTDTRPHPAAKLVMRLHKNDMVAFGEGADRRILRVAQMWEGRVILAGHSEGGNLRNRNKDPLDQFNYINGSLSRLVAEKARKVHITPSGRVLDQGPVL